MLTRTIRNLIVAAAAFGAVAGLGTPASAEFTSGDVNTLLNNLAERGDLDAKQQKALEKAQALADKDYSDFAKEVIAYAKVAGLLDKAFPGDEEVQGALQGFCDEEGGINSIGFLVVFGDNGVAEAGVAAAGGGVKGALFYAKKVANPFNKANLSSDCVKKIKGWAKALKGAAVVIKKYGNVD